MSKFICSIDCSCILYRYSSYIFLLVILQVQEVFSFCLACCIFWWSDEILCSLVIVIVYDIVWYLSQVALHLLSEKEKNDLAQLVSTMVSYSITHRSIKSDPLPSSLGHQAADVSELSFDPPISGFISFQVCVVGCGMWFYFILWFVLIIFFLQSNRVIDLAIMYLLQLWNRCWRMR